MSTKTIIICFLFLTIAITSYSQETNKSAVGEKVIAHYTKIGDPEKLKAAKFIVENMKYHISYESNTLNEYYIKVNEISKQFKYPTSIKPYQELYNELGNINEGKSILNDAECMNEQDIIHNIDEAFNDWHNGNWARHLSFEQFCEYLLPYRIGNEKYENWRHNLRELFFNYAQSGTNCDERRNSAYWAAYNICDGIKDFNFHIDDKALPKNEFDLPLSVVMNMKMGICNDYARLSAYIMRACGIPVCIDYTPQWPNKAHNHTWNGLINNTGKTVPFLGSETYPGIPERLGDKMAKVYRKTFAYQSNSLHHKNKKYQKILPPTLDSPFYIDVSKEYFNGSDISFKLPENKFDRKFAYIAVFNNESWIPIDYSEIDSTNTVCFSSLGREILYMPVFWGHNGAIPCSNPFYIEANGKKNYSNLTCLINAPSP